MPQKRMRIFAGSNGSGKSTMIKILPDSINLGTYINSHVLENELKSGIKLSNYNIDTDTSALHKFFDQSDFV